MRIVLHCGLHKTGSTYIQRKPQTNLLLPPKKHLSTSSAISDPTPSKSVAPNVTCNGAAGIAKRPAEPTLASSSKQTNQHPAGTGGRPRETIHTILSFEAIFGTLKRSDPPGRPKVIEQRTSRWASVVSLRQTHSRTKRLMKINGAGRPSLGHRSIARCCLPTEIKSVRATPS